MSLSRHGWLLPLRMTVKTMKPGQCGIPAQIVRVIGPQLKSAEQTLSHKLPPHFKSPKRIQAVFPLFAFSLKFLRLSIFLAWNNSSDDGSLVMS